jgi:hypothetical protein
VLIATAMILALGLLSTIPCLTAEAGSLHTPTPVHEQPQASTEDRAHEPISLEFCQRGLPSPKEALRRIQTTDRGVDSRHSEPSVLLVSRVSMPGIKLPSWLALFRGRLPAATHSLLHVLFCTWLA